MELSTPLGIIVAIVGIIGGMIMEGGDPTGLIGIPAAMIVIVGSLGATLVATPMGDLKFGITAMIHSTMPPKHDFAGIVEKILELANLARREGLLALEAYTNDDSGDPFLKSCLTMAIDGSEAAVIRDTAETQMHINEESLTAGMKFWESWGALAPTVGVLGAVMGLMHVMHVLDQPELIGPGIATAFIATVYGVGFSNIWCLPLSFKLKRQIQHDNLYKSMILEGVVGIQSGMAPGALRSKLGVYVAH